MCTANVLDTIPGPLLDRMEVINLSGYITDEKIAIANQYLIPKAMKETGIVENQVLPLPFVTLSYTCLIIVIIIIVIIIIIICSFLLFSCLFLMMRLKI